MSTGYTGKKLKDDNDNISLQYMLRDIEYTVMEINLLKLKNFCRGSFSLSCENRIKNLPSNINERKNKKHTGGMNVDFTLRGNALNKQETYKCFSPEVCFSSRGAWFEKKICKEHCHFGITFYSSFLLNGKRENAFEENALCYA